MMNDIVSMRHWEVTQGREFPIAIAGPCSAETEEQLFRTCREIKKQDISMLRAGIWKPRTRPGMFEGVGEIGLQWLRDIKKELQMPATVEVATAQHVELALKYEIDVLWIGARSTANPFTVQEIADALRGTHTPVIVKNPVNPDLSLWLGAIERVYNAGIRQVAALHRGFSSYDKSKYRNQPMWQIAIALKSELPQISMLCDPSHIGGDRKLIHEIAQKAIDFNYDGLMIETHISPDEAWSDAKQQITPQRLGEILHDIRIRRNTSDSPDYLYRLEELRRQIDRIDHEIVESVAARMRLVDQLGYHKKENNIAVFQVERWLEVFRTRPEWGVQLGMDKDFVGALYKVLHDESLRIQTQIMESESASSAG